MKKDKEGERLGKQVDAMFYKNKKIRYVMQNLVYVASTILMGVIIISGLIVLATMFKYAW